MSFFDFLTEKIAIDSGTSNTLITQNGKVVLDCPSIIVINQITGKIIAVGKEASAIQGKIHKNIKTLYPNNNGVIANYDAAEKMLKTFMEKIASIKSTGFMISYNMIISIPYESTDVEIRAVKESAKRLNAKKVFLIHEPMAAAIGLGIDVLQPKANMIIDIGGGTTEIAVIVLGGIISGRSVKIAGNVFNENIIQFIREIYNLQIGEQTAEKMKIGIGAAIEDIDTPPEDIEIQGRDILSGKPKQITVSYKDVVRSLDASILQIENDIIETLSRLPPEISVDIYNSGIYLTGGGSMLRGLDKRLSETTGLPVSIGEAPLKAVVKGSDIVLKNLNQYTNVLVKRYNA